MSEHINGNVNTESPKIGDKLAPYLADYEAMRKEIEWLLRGATQYQGFAILLLGGVFTIGSWAYEKSPGLVIPLLLTTALMFAILGYLYFRQHEELHLVAMYIRDSIRPRVREITNDDRIWEWEEFKGGMMERRRAHFRHLFPPMIKLVNSLRMAIFTLPSMISVISVVEYVLSKGVMSLRQMYTTNVLVSLTAWFALDVVVLSTVVVYVWLRGDLLLSIRNSSSSEGT